MTEVGEAANEGTIWGWAVGPPVVVVRLPASVLGVVSITGAASDLLGSWSDHQPLSLARSDRLRVQSDRQQWPAIGTLGEHEVLPVVWHGSRTRSVILQKDI
jgi:hypothetical protein